MFTFQTFQPGSRLGGITDVIDTPTLDRWRKLYPWDEAVGAEAPAGMVAPIIMRAYMKVVAPRPPGNIHARQVIELSACPNLGETIHTEIFCMAKQIKNERRHVTLESISSGDAGRRLFSARLHLIWAV